MPVKVGEGSRAVHGVANDEQAPAVADQIQSARNRAGRVGPGVGTVPAAVAASTWLLLVGPAVAGLFAVVAQTTVAYAAALSTPDERGRTLGTVTSGVVIGILGGRIAAGALAAV